ncbi:MAG: AsnC family transcriptional regulator [Methanomassiliicoccales archaeon]
MRGKQKLDDKDRQLLIILANNPEWTYEQIAKEMGMTSRSVGYRIERLREMKVLQKANLIYYDRLGDLIYAATIKFDTGTSHDEQEKALNEVKDHDAIIQVFTAIGAFSAIILFHAEDPKEAERVARELVIAKSCFSSYEISQITDIFSIYRHYM